MPVDHFYFVLEIDRFSLRYGVEILFTFRATSVGQITSSATSSCDGDSARLLSPLLPLLLLWFSWLEVEDATRLCPSLSMAARLEEASCRGVRHRTHRRDRVDSDMATTENATEQKPDELHEQKPRPPQKILFPSLLAFDSTTSEFFRGAQPRLLLRHFCHGDKGRGEV